MAGTVAGIITDGVSLSPIAGAQVLIFDTSTVTLITNGSGEYTSPALPMGSYNIYAHAEGYQTSTVMRINISNNYTNTFNFVLFPEIAKVNLYGQKSDGTWEPLKTSSPGVLTVNNLTQSESLTGICYVVDTGPCSVPVDQYLFLQLSNPPESGKRLNIKHVTGGTSASISASNMILNVLKNASFPETGVTLTPGNTNLGFPDTSLVMAKYVIRTDPDVGGSLLWTYMVTGGTQADYSGLLIMPPDTHIVVSLKNTDNRINTFAATICWSEEQI